MGGEAESGKPGNPLAGRSPTRRKEYLLAAGALCLLLAVSFSPVVFGGRTLQTSSWCPGAMPSGPYGLENSPGRLPVVDPGASSWQHGPWAAQVREELKSGRWPLWNPHSGVGSPLLANMQSAPFSPLRIPLHLFGSPVVWDLYDLLRLLVAGFFSYLFLRLWDRSPAASLAGAAAFMLCGYNILYLNAGHLDVDVLLPAFLFVSESLFRKGRPRFIIGAAVLVCLAVWGGMPESAFFVLASGASYYAFRTAFTAIRERRGLRFTLRHAFRFGLPVLLGFGLSGPQLLPFLEYLGRSWTSHSPLTGATSNPLSGAVSLVIPYFFGRIQENWSGLNSHMLLPYVGAIPLLLALVAVRARKTIEEKQVVFFFAGLALLALGKAYGLVAVNWVGHLPVLDRLIFSKYLVPEMSFSIAVLAAFGFDSWRDVRNSTGRLFAAAAVLFGFVFLYLGLKPLELFPQLRSPALRRSAALQALITLAAVAAFMSVGLLSRKVLRFPLPALGLVAILASELVLYVPRNRAVSHDPAAPPPYVGLLRSDREPFRVLPLKGALYPDTNLYFGLDCPTVLDAMYPERYMRFLRTCLSSRISDRFTGEELDGMSGSLLYFLRLLNVKYVVSPMAISSAIPGILKGSRVEPASRWGIGSTTYTIGGLTKRVLSQHPPSRIIYPLSVGDGTRLSFSIALAPGCWSPEKGDGVRFRLSVRDGEVTREAFVKTIDPKNIPRHRRWFDGSVDLEAYRNRSVDLIFETEPLRTTVFDWAGWGDIRFGDREADGGMELIYDREMKVYRVTGFRPRAALVPCPIPVPNGEQALARLRAGTLDLSRFVLLEADRPPGFSADSPPDGPPESVRPQIVAYRSNEVVIKVESGRGGVLVLSDLYYPGWKALVDGRERPILRADYLFRAVILGPGRHTVRFVYAPRSFTWGWLAFFVSLAGLGVLVRSASGRRPPSGGGR
jgi:hypothetical protein